MENNEGVVFLHGAFCFCGALQQGIMLRAAGSSQAAAIDNWRT
jgi:hypothetical protein